MVPLRYDPVMPALSEDLRRIVDDPRQRVHVVGAGGTGMSALAQFRALGGGRVSGSDRSFDRGELAEERTCLAGLGVELYPQDGSGVAGAAVLVTSTAVESAIPDLAAARSQGIPLLHRAELLAHHVDGVSLAIAGTSGKSTVTAMAFDVLAGAGLDPGLITGGRLNRLKATNALGNAVAGAGPLVVEADESDGSLIRHAPLAGVLLNLHKDHMEPAKVLEQFRTFRARTRGGFAVSDDAELAEFRGGALVFGRSRDAALRLTDLELLRDGVRFRVDGVRFDVPAPGAHNAWNALAAAAAGRLFDVPLAAAAAALAEYQGVHRRFERAGAARGVEVFDDFAHNPEKLRAVLELAQSRSERVLALFQPHGFAPMKFLRAELVEALAQQLRPVDRFWFAPIFFAGGTVSRDIASEDLVADLCARGAPVALAPDRTAWPSEIAARARSGDTVLVLGARDPTLPDLARAVVRALG